LTVTINATNTLAENGYTTSDFTAATTEFIIDTAIDLLNLLAEQSIAAMAGSSGTKTVITTRDQAAVLKMLISVTLRENKKTALSSSSSTSGSSSAGKSVGIGSLSMSESSSVSSAISAAATINNPQNSAFAKLFLDSCAALKRKTLGPPIYVGYAPVE
jgi:hypothetical protein